METLKILGDAAAGASTDFSYLGVIFNQIRGVGKLLTQDFRQLSSRGVLSLQDIAKYYSKIQGREVGTDEAQQMISKGKVSFEDVRNILRDLTSEGGRFNNMMERQSQSLLGLLSTLRDGWNSVLRAIGEALMPIAKPLVRLGVMFHRHVL